MDLKAGALRAWWLGSRRGEPSTGGGGAVRHSMSEYEWYNDDMCAHSRLWQDGCSASNADACMRYWSCAREVRYHGTCGQMVWWQQRSAACCPQDLAAKLVYNISFMYAWQDEIQGMTAENRQGGPLLGQATLHTVPRLPTPC